MIDLPRAHGCGRPASSANMLCCDFDGLMEDELEQASPAESWMSR